MATIGLQCNGLSQIHWQSIHGRSANRSLVEIC